MEPAATTAAAPLAKAGTVHAHPLALRDPRKTYPGFDGRWVCDYCKEEQRCGSMWHCEQVGCAFDACDACCLHHIPARVPWTKAQTPEQTAKRKAVMHFRRKIMEQVRERNRVRARPPKEAERKRKAEQRRAKAEPRTQSLPQDTATKARIASGHRLALTPAARVYPEARRGDGWLCSICHGAFLIRTCCAQYFDRCNQHGRSAMYRCTHDGCDHQECDACHWSSTLPRAPCIATHDTQTAAEASHPEPNFSPIPVALWEGMQ